MTPYGKRADLIVHEDDPFNAETSPAALAEAAVTATDAFYVRGHGEVPEVDPAAWRLRVHGLVERELELSLSTLREAFRTTPRHYFLDRVYHYSQRLGRWREVPARPPTRAALRLVYADRPKPLPAVRRSRNMIPTPPNPIPPRGRAAETRP